MPTLPCNFGTKCNKGPEGGIWRTVDIDFNNAMELLEHHVRNSHRQVVVNTAPATQLEGEKLNQPQLRIKDGQIEEETWEFFQHQWKTYKAQSNLTVATKQHLESCLGDEVTVIIFSQLGQTGWDK